MGVPDHTGTLQQKHDLYKSLVVFEISADHPPPPSSERPLKGPLFLLPFLYCNWVLQVAERHQFLTSLGRAQYDPGKPQYVSPAALTEGSDLEFAENVARSTIQLFNAFLKTL